MNNDELPEEDDDIPEDAPVYLVDPVTEELLMTALNCMITLADAQVTESDGAALIVIADTLAARFALNKFEVVETVHTDDDGDEEIIYTPKSGSIIPDDEPDDETFH
jgi:hypothetical protein